MPTLSIRDESRPGTVLTELRLDLPHRVTLRDLIATRVREEVAKANADRDRPAHLLVRPTEAEATLNGYELRQTDRLIDWRKQADVALDAFGRNAFFVLLDGKQVESLDDELSLTADSDVRFLRLTPLVGG